MTDTSPFTSAFPRITLVTTGLVMALLACASPALAQQGPPSFGNPICQRLEGQLQVITRGGDQAQDAQARRYEEAIIRQEAELERTVLQARNQGCESTGLFSIFNGQAAQCGPLTNRIQQMRTNLDRMISDLQRIRPGNAAGDREGQRRSVIVALAQNNCGPQYAAAAREFQQGGGLFGGLFGGNVLPGPEGGPVGNTFRTVCVRTCDGFFFPISFATSEGRFADDEQKCQRQCPASEARLFVHRNPGEDMNQAVSTNGQPYSSLPNAFKYRQEFNPSCLCKPANQSWADAMKHLDERGALGEGDIVVTDERAKKMSQPVRDTRQSSQKQTSAGNSDQNKSSEISTPQAAPAQPSGKIRAVGPIFVAPKQ